MSSEPGGIAATGEADSAIHRAVQWTITVHENTPPSVQGNGPALLFDLANYSYLLESPAPNDIDKIEVPGLDEFDKDLDAQWNQTVADALQVHAGVVATADPIAQASDEADAELNDTLQDDAAALVTDGAAWAAADFDGALAEMPEEAWQPLPTWPTPDTPQPVDTGGGDNTGSVLPLD